VDWMQIRGDAAVYFADPALVRGIKLDDILKSSASSRILYLGPLDWTWGKDDPQIETTLRGAETTYDLRCNQVEELIHESGALIERAFCDLLKYDDLNLERFKILVEFVE
jgi:hypothetical protein